MSGGGRSSSNEAKIPKELAPYVTGALQEQSRLYNKGAPEYFPGQTVASYNNPYLDASRKYQVGVANNLAGIGAQGLGTASGMMQSPYKTQLAGLGFLPAVAGSNTVSSMASNGQGAGVNVLGYADPNKALTGFLDGSQSNNNPYLTQAVNAAQRSGMRAFGDSANTASRAFATDIAPQLAEARSNINTAKRAFQEEVLPGIRRANYGTPGAGGSRQQIAEGIATRGFGENLMDEQFKLASIANQGANNTYQDILRNQSRASTDAGDIAAKMYSGAFDSGQANQLQAANIAAGLQGGAQSAYNLQASLDNSASDRMLDAGKFGLSNYNNAITTGINQYNTGVGSLGTLASLYGQPGTVARGLGTELQRYQQQLIDAEREKYNYITGADQNLMDKYVGNLGVLMGTPMVQHQQNGTSPLSSGIGGAMVGGSVGGPWGAAIGGGLGLLGGGLF